MKTNSLWRSVQSCVSLTLIRWASQFLLALNDSRSVGPLSPSSRTLPNKLLSHWLSSPSDTPLHSALNHGTIIFSLGRVAAGSIQQTSTLDEQMLPPLTKLCSMVPSVDSETEELESWAIRHGWGEDHISSSSLKRISMRSSESL